MIPYTQILLLLHGRGHGRYCGCGRKYNLGHTCDKFGSYNCNYWNDNLGAKNVNDHPKWTKNNEKKSTIPKNYEHKCYCCGMKGH